MAWSPPGAPVELELTSLEAGAALAPRELSVPEDPRPSRLAVLSYEAAPTALRMTPGPVPLAAPGQCLGVAVPEPEVGFEIEIADGRPGAWTTGAPRRPPWLDEVRHLVPCPCERWSYRDELVLEGEGWGVVRGDEFILFRRRLYALGVGIVDLSERVAVDLPPEHPRRYEAAVLAPGGRVFAAATSTSAPPEVLEFTLDRRLLPLPAAPFSDGDEPHAMVAGEGEPLELFVLTAAGRILRYEEGTGWTVLQDADLVVGLGGGRQTAGITWHERGVITAAVHDSSALIRTSPDRPSTVFVPPLPDFLQAVRGLLQTESFGLVVANFGGGLARMIELDRWEILESDTGLGRINTMVRHPEGFLMTGALGWAQMHPEAGVCPTIESDAARQFLGIAAWRELMVGWARGLSDNLTVVRFFERAE